MNFLVLKIFFAILLIAIAIYDEITIERLMKEKKEIVDTLTYERKKLYKYKKEAEYLNIFKKEIELISKENKLKSAIADLKRLSHFYTKE